MLQFKAFASSSHGNCYLVTADGLPPLLLDAGIPIKRIREHLMQNNLSLTDLAGCCVDHSHGDHSKAVKDLLKAGVDCHMSIATALALNIEAHHRTCVFSDNLMRQIGGWSVMPFNLQHDVPCLGFFIQHGDERLLFIPDTGWLEQRFYGITILAIECNHVEDILSEKIINKHIPSVVGRRVRRNHLSLEVLIEMLKANDLSQCREIHLLHLSDSNSDERRMIREVQAATGVRVYASV